MKANRMLKLKDDNRGFAKEMGGIIALLVAIIIGVLVFYSVNDNLNWSADSNNAAVGGKAAWNSTNSTAATVFTLLPIVGIVIIAGLILMVVTRFGGGAGGV